MKKKLLISLFVILNIISVFGAETWYKLTEIKIKPVDCEWSEWMECLPEPLDMKFNDKTKQIIIYSVTVQTFSYSQLFHSYDNVCHIIYGDPTDSYGNKVGFEFFNYNNGEKYLLIKYSDVKYMYKLYLK